MRLSFTGVGTALITPFTKAGAVDEKAVRALADRQAAAGVHFLVPCGTTGETPTLSDDERRKIVEIVADAVEGRAMVLAGAGGYDTREVIHAVKAMEKSGAHGILSVTPYYNKPTPEGLYQHYKAIAESTKLPIVVYNVPGRTASNIEARTTLALAEHPRIVAVKEASGNLAQVTDILRHRPPEFSVLSGDDALTLAVMAAGGDGVISVVSNATPRLMSRLVDWCAGGDFAEARALAMRLTPWFEAAFIDSNPIPVKAALAMMGRIENSLRLPLVPLMDAHQAPVRAALTALEALPA